MSLLVTYHAIERFNEKITTVPWHVTESFIQMDIEKSELLYCCNGVEKRLCNGIVYVVERGKQHKVLTLYKKVN